MKAKLKYKKIVRYKLNKFIQTISLIYNKYCAFHGKYM